MVWPPECGPPQTHTLQRDWLSPPRLSPEAGKDKSHALARPRRSEALGAPGPSTLPWTGGPCLPQVLVQKP